eukprot:gene12910-27237_t
MLHKYELLLLFLLILVLEFAAGSTVLSGNLDTIRSYGPHSLWAAFADLSNIPRPSKKEDQVIEYLKSFALSRDLVWKKDKANNMLIKRPGSNGGENSKPILIQGHIDMVTEKNSDKVHNFDVDPITLVSKGDWLYADGTTLGADNGIGVCAALALLSSGKDITLPPLECLFTVDEETGLTGARELEPSVLGITAKTLLNLDTEEWGAIYVGCAGGGESILQIKVDRHNFIDADKSVDISITVKGLTGGHSGADIHHNRGNSVRMLASATQRFMSTFPIARLVDISGGDKRNAIPREAMAIVRLPHKYEEEARRFILNLNEVYRTIFKDTDPSLQLQATVLQLQSSYWTMRKDSSDRLLTMLRILPNGALKMSGSFTDQE